MDAQDLVTRLKVRLGIAGSDKDDELMELIQTTYALLKTRFPIFKEDEYIEQFLIIEESLSYYKDVDLLNNQLYLVALNHMKLKNN